MTAREGALLKVTAGRSPVSAWTFGAATRDVRIRIGSSQDATWRFLDPNVAPIHFEMFWDGGTLWVTAPYGPEVRVDGHFVRDWMPLQGRFRIEFGSAAIEGMAPESDATDHERALGAFREVDAAPPVNRHSAPQGFQAASAGAIPDPTRDELPGEPTVYLRDRPRGPGTPPDGWEDEPTRAEPLPDLDEDRPTALPAPAAPSEAGALRSEATVFAPLPEPPASSPSSGHLAPAPAAPTPATPAHAPPGPSSVHLAPELAAPTPAPSATPEADPPPPTFVLPPEPTRRGFFARMFRPAPKVEQAPSSPREQKATSAPKAFLEQGPILFGARPKVWLPALLVLLLAGGLMTASALRRRRASRAVQPKPPATATGGEARQVPSASPSPMPRKPSAAPATPPKPTRPSPPAVEASREPVVPSEEAPGAAYTPKEAVEWLATGRLRMALAAYEALREAHPEVGAFREAARILAKEVENLCAPPVRNPSACAPPPAPPGGEP